MAALLIKHHRPLLILAVILLAFFIRIYRIDQVPASLYYDEVDLGYQARSLLETHHDYRGRQSPFYVLSFNDPRVPIPAYLTAISTLLFQTEEYQVRMPTVILGTLIVLLSFLLVRLWTASYWAGLVTALVFATNPWQIQNSRWALEQVYCGFFLLLTIYTFFSAINRRSFKLLLLSSALLGLSVYTYRVMSLLSPLIFVSLVGCFLKELKKFSPKWLISAAIIYGLLVGPFIYFTALAAPDIPRIQQVGIFSDKLEPILIQRNRELDSGDFANPVLGKSAVWYSKIFHNKIASNIKSFSNNYLETFSSEFLFISGTHNPRESAGRMGELLTIDLVAYLIGFYWVVTHRKQKKYLFLAILFLITPIPSALTMDGAKHGSRLFIVSSPLLIIVGLGLWRLFIWARHHKFSTQIYLFITMFWLISFVFYLHQYFVHFPIESARDYGYGFKQAMLNIKRLSPDYQHVYMVGNNDPPMIYFLFWNHIPPREVQNYGSQFNVGQDFNKPLDKYKAINLYVNKQDFANLGQLLEPNTLYLITPRNIPDNIKDPSDFPPDINVIDTIHYPDTQIAFYLIAKK